MSCDILTDKYYCNFLILTPLFLRLRLFVNIVVPSCLHILVNHCMETTTSKFPKSGRTTSRVLQQPGGKSSVQLGWGDSPKKEDKPKEDAKVVDSIAVAKEGSTAASSDTKKNGAKVDANVEAKVETTVSSNAFATGSAQNTGNVLTDRPTSRVTQPPGGKSSISF